MAHPGAARWRLAMLGIVTVALLALTLQPVHAQPAEPIQNPCTWQEPRGRWRDALCPEDRLGFSRVRVFSMDGPWQTGVEPTTESGDTWWLFERYGKPGPSLIAHFYRQGQSAVADLYDDADHDTWVRYRDEGDRIVVMEADGRWSIQAVAPDGWWERNGVVNYNLDLSVSGPIAGMIDSVLYLNQLSRDGSTILDVHVRDNNRNGRPDYEWRQAHPPLQDRDGFYHSSVMVNTNDDEPGRIGAVPFWPHLGTLTYELVKPYFQSPAPLQMEWDAGLFRYVGEFVASRGRAGNYFVYTIERIQLGTVTPTNFESPFAFYHFGDSDPPYPDVLVRTARGNKGDVFYLNGDLPLPSPIQQIDYSWRYKDDVQLASRSGFEQAALAGGRWDRPQVNDLAPLWDFKVSLGGRHEVDGLVRFPEFTLRQPPYETLPRWVTERTWDFATFLAVEGETYPSTEGLYELYPLEGDNPGAGAYLMGVTRKSPIDNLFVLPFGQTRGEISLQFNDRPWLYFSPIDRKLHLVGAREGMWNIDNAQLTRQRDLDGDGHLDEWRHVRVTASGDQTVQTLVVVGGVAMLSDGNSISFKPVGDVQQEVFRTLPPDDSESWFKFRDLIESNPSPYGPTDFAGMFAGLPGAPTVARNVSATSFAYDKGELTFVLTVAPSPQIDPPTPTMDWLKSLLPGRYLVRRQVDGAYRVEPYHDPSLQVAPVTTVEQTLSSTQTATLVARITNAGSEDMRGIPVAFVAEYPNGTQDVVGPETVDLARGASREVRTQWAPSRPGDVSLRAVVGQTALDLTAQARQRGRPVASPTPVVARPPGSRELPSVTGMASIEGPVVQMTVAPPAAAASSAQIRLRLLGSEGGLGSGVLLGLIGVLPVVAVLTILVARPARASR